MKTIRRVIPIGYQNMTEGPVTKKFASVAVAITAECSHEEIRDGFRGYRHWFPARDSHQSISWDPDRFVVHRKGYIRFHQSGKAEGWPIPTPGRGLIWVRGHHPAIPHEPVVLFGMWWLNSWFPLRADKWTQFRRNVVETTTIPKVRSFLRRQRRAGYHVTGAGDTNSLKWSGQLPGLSQVKSKGLDRAWIDNWSDGFRLYGSVTEGPKTGKGRQMQHESVHWKVQVAGQGR